MATFEDYSGMQGSYPARMASVLPLAAGITVLLFLLMRTMIAMQFQLDETTKTYIPPISPVIPDIDKPTAREMPLPDAVEPPPPPPRIATQSAQNPADTGTAMPMALPPMKLPPLSQGNALRFVPDRTVQPIIRTTPAYPLRAQEQGREGTCTALFDVSALGKPYNIKVTCSDPVFVRAARRAVEQWKYNPKIQDGVAVPRRNMQTPFQFRLDKSGH